MADVGIYVLSPFDTENPDSTQQAEIQQAGSDLGSAGFETVVLASFHISSTGDINYNNTPIASGGAVVADLDPNLASVFGGMKTSGGGQVQNLLMSFGGGGCFSGQAIGYWDFLHLKNLIAQDPNPANNPFFQNLAAIFAAYPIDGVDIDLEVYQSAFLCQNGFAATYQEFTSTLTTLAGWLSGQGKLTTIAPFDSFDFWASLLEATYVGGTQQIAWVNLQGGDLSPADDGAFVQALAGKSIGVSNLDAFVSSGMQISSGATPNDVQAAYAQAGLTSAGGGWLWNFSSITPSQSSAFATAVAQGLAGVSPR